MGKKKSSLKNSLIRQIYDQGEKVVFKTFIAFFYFSSYQSFSTVASKKIGNAVIRNRAKRRLKELFRTSSLQSNENLNLILLARNSTANKEFYKLIKDLSLLEQKISERHHILI